MLIEVDRAFLALDASNFPLATTEVLRRLPGARPVFDKISGETLFSTRYSHIPAMDLRFGAKSSFHGWDFPETRSRINMAENVPSVIPFPEKPVARNCRSVTSPI